MNLLNIEDPLKARNKVKPVIKWTGGKFGEFPLFEKYIPSFDKYFEPFFGGGGVFFALQTSAPAFLNDKSKDLFQFYSLIHSAAFKKQLLLYADVWDEVGDLSNKLVVQLLPMYKSFFAGEVDIDVFNSTVKETVLLYSTASTNYLFSEDFIIYPERFTKKLIASIVDKAKRIKAICFKENRSFDSNEITEHIETGIKSGLYLFLRELTNLQFAGELVMNKEKAAANWYFVREFCYASMFRYNGKGEFNIPYGGIAYNRKNFRVKVENIFSKSVQGLFSNAQFYNLDFAEFLQRTSPGKNDFIFLDPPYDSEFSEYDQNAFTKDDQVRLRDVLMKTQAKWMLVIKETEFIRSLYDVPQCRFIEFDKTYTYNVRGRNNRDTVHLIIVNY